MDLFFPALPYNTAILKKDAHHEKLTASIAPVKRSTIPPKYCFHFALPFRTQTI